MSVKVGLTGLWGSGKTTVLKLFEELGARTLDLDEVVHELLQDEGIKERIRQTFGNEVFTKEGIDRKALARRAFSSEQARKSLESILHPEVFKRMMDFLNQQDKVLVVEVPLLYETSSERFFDLTVLVRADENLRKERLLKKGYTLKEIKQRLRHQLPEEEKIRRADYIIDNSGTLEYTKRQVSKIWEDLQKR